MHAEHVVGTPSRTEHPSPMLRRQVIVLDGTWEFALTDGRFDRTITVPYAPETPASGVGLSTVERCWYRKRLDVVPPTDNERVLVHFGAVDRIARVVANGDVVAVHEGGYTPFSADVTEACRTGTLELVVYAEDPVADLDAPRGKQDWQPSPHSIWYPRTTGIWRSVWLEYVPRTHISGIWWKPSLAGMTIRACVDTEEADDASQVEIVLRHGGTVVARASGRVSGGTAELLLAVGTGAHDERWSLVWTPRTPVLLDAEVTLRTPVGHTADVVESYSAIREVCVDNGTVLLNGRPVFLRMVLDQGYWPGTGLTPPDTDALRHDLTLARAMGFNGIRKHQKTEDPRFFALADEMGMLVWVEMPSAYRATTTAAQRLLREWADVVVAHRNHPSVMSWVPINESWGVPGVAAEDRQRSLLQAMANIARALDGTRPVSVNDGWETIGGEIVGIHDYTQDPEVLRQRYADAQAIDRLLQGPGTPYTGHRIDLDRAPAHQRAVILSEFGGISLEGTAAAEGGWGYARAKDAEDLLSRYRAQWQAVHHSAGLAGACWTQLTDTYQEANGLLTMERSPKVNLGLLERATRGRSTPA